MKYLWATLFCTLLISLLPCQAQLDNRFFADVDSLPTTTTKPLRLQLRTLGFVRNNEYFNNIADGYTLFGYHLLPYLTYQPTANLMLKGGIFLRQDFGGQGFRQIEPVFTIKWQKGPWTMNFGTLDGHLNHQYLEPLYNFERTYTNRLENGLQWVYNSPRRFADLWVNWQNVIYPQDSAQEELSGGLVWHERLLAGPRWQLWLPFQAYAYHQGGQIDITNQPLTTIYNMALGAEARWQTKGLPWLQQLRFSAYALLYNNVSPQPNVPFDNGHGWYYNLEAQTNWATIMLSWWRGSTFYAIHGGPLYQSISSTVNNPEFRAPQRQLLYLRLIKDFSVAGARASARLEPVYDFDSQKLEFSAGFYLNVNANWLIINTNTP